MDREEAAKELMAMLEEAQEGPYYSEEEVRAHLLEILAPRNQVYMTGDTHGQFERVIEFCARREVEPETPFLAMSIYECQRLQNQRSLFTLSCYF